MANLPLAFAEMLGGGIILLAGMSGDTIGNIVRGQFTIQPLVSGGSTATSGAASVGTGVTGTTSAGSTGDPGGISGTVEGDITQSDVASIAKSHGWGLSEIGAWLKVINLESNGTINDTNSTSGAYGIAQFIDGPSEYAQYGGNATSVTGELTAMANYIEQRYGTPSAALSFHLANGYY